MLSLSLETPELTKQIANQQVRQRVLRLAGWSLGFLLIGSGALLTGEELSSALSESDTDAESAERQTLLIVVGAPGADEYRPIFTGWARKWREAATEAAAEFHLIGLDDEAPEFLLDRDDSVVLGGDLVEETPLGGVEKKSAGPEQVIEDEGECDEPTTEGDPPNSAQFSTATDRELLIQKVSLLARRESLEPLWVVLLGHGTFDGNTAKFNLRGPDISAEELNEALGDSRRPLIVINCSSASSPFVNVLSGSNRVIVTATRSGFELNYARFGGYLADAVTNPAADLDKDEQVSLLEAFLFASAQVAQFYADESRLATEHAILDDNGDGLGTPADWFRGVRAVRAARDGAELDGARARRMHLIRSTSERSLSPEIRQRRDELEEQLEELRATKSQREPDAYYRELEDILVEIARIYP